MNFPLSVLDIDNYQQVIRELLVDDECIIFFDTNIFARFYSLHSMARAEFSNWSKSLIQKNRIKVPVWVLHEYTNRFVNDKTKEYFGPIDKLKTMSKEFIHIRDFLTMSTPSTDQDFLDKLDSLKKALDEVNNVAKSLNGDHLAIHDELETLFKTAILKSDIEKLVQQAAQYKEARYGQRIPPGFEDSAKSVNSLGDLVIWYEILEYSKAKGLKKVIFLTNDNKKDWMYTPPKIHESGRTVPNPQRPYKIADPRLVYEFSLATGSEEFYIIHFEALVKALIASGGRDYISIAKALQIEPRHHDQLNNDQLDDDFDYGPFEDEEFSSFDGGEVVQVEEQLEVRVENINDPIELSDFRRSDIGGFLESESLLYNIIKGLNLYDWYMQNDAINQLNMVDFRQLPETILSRNHLFYLGIAIYESACNGSWRAADYMTSLDNKLSKLSDFNANFILAGMLHEIYFHTNDKFRYNELKSTFVDEVLVLQENERFLHTINFISELLTPYSDFLILIPSINPPNIELKVTYEIQQVLDNPVLSRVIIINDILFGEKSLVRPNPSRQQHVRLHGEQHEIEKRIAEFYAIPLKYLDISYDPPIEFNFDDYFNLNHTMALGNEMEIYDGGEANDDQF